jgi:hypothetical protein
MQSAQQLPQEVVSPANGQSLPHDLFALTDEQILEISPESPDVEVSNGQLPLSEKESASTSPSSLQATSSANGQQKQGATEASQAQTSSTDHSAQPRVAVPLQPPEWLAQRMKDPWNGDEAREFWQGIQNERQDTAAYREVFAKPEDARALKELYPGGVGEARAASERARVLDDIDRAYFGTAGKSAQDVGASREQLAQMMMREDPAAFREMVFAGLRALEQSGPQTGTEAGSRVNAISAAAARAATQAQGELKSAPANSPARAQGDTSGADRDARLSAYVSFEKAANEDLERSIGRTISRTIEQALPNSGRDSQGASSRSGQAQPLQSRLSAAIRQDVEVALKGDRQLGEQIAQILTARRFDNETRAQVVRLIDDRARQLVPSAAKRVLNDWTQTTLAAHHTRNQKTEMTEGRKDLAAASAGPNGGSSRTVTPKSVDYRKLSDEQILEM